MRDDTKKSWLNAAEVFDSWRVVPRIIVIAYLSLLIWITIYFAVMYFALPPLERSATLTAFVSVVLTAAYGAFPFIVKIYMDNGRNWDAQAPPAAGNS